MERLTEQLEALGRQLGGHIRKACDIAAWAPKSLD
jgi:hypothetical protein